MSDEITWEELGAKFGVTRQTINNWRKLAGAPDSRSVAAWENYVSQNHLGERQHISSLKDEKTRHEIEILKARLAREKRAVIARDEVNELLLHIATRGRTMLYQFLETEAPPKLEGMAAAQMRPILREMADSIADEMADLIEKFKKQ